MLRPLCNCRCKEAPAGAREGEREDEREDEHEHDTARPPGRAVDAGGSLSLGNAEGAILSISRDSLIDDVIGGVAATPPRPPSGARSHQPVQTSVVDRSSMHGELFLVALPFTGGVQHPTLYKEAAKIKRPKLNESKRDSRSLSKFLKTFSDTRLRLFLTIVDRPKLFIERLIWIDRATFP